MRGLASKGRQGDRNLPVSVTRLPGLSTSRNEQRAASDGALGPYSGWDSYVTMPMTLAPDPYILVMTGAGLLIALVAWLPLALKRMPLSLPIVCIGIGAALFLLPQVTLRPLPTRYPEVTERFAEFVVIIALMGAGLKIDRVFGWQRWSITWRLLVITMPLGILTITLLAG
jgi:hypothetical protein